MNDERDLMIPRRLDDPPKFLFWDFDVTMLFLFGVMMGMMAGYTMTGFGIGFVFGWGYSKLKGGRHAGYLVHLAYWHLPAGFSLRRAPPSAKRVFFG